MTQDFGRFLTNLSSAQSLKSLPIQGFCLYDVEESLKLAPEKGILLPIRATEPRKVNIVRISGSCVSYNFSESLLGIETDHSLIVPNLSQHSVIIVLSVWDIETLLVCLNLETLDRLYKLCNHKKQIPKSAYIGKT